MATAPEPDIDGPSHPPAGATARLRRRIETASQRSTDWLELRRRERVPLDLAVSFYERDRELFASVLGAAIALRLFLFLVPAVAVGVALLTVAVGQDSLGRLVEEAGVTGQLAEQIDEATRASRSTWLAVLVSATGLTVWAGRNLTQVLATCSIAAWRLDPRRNRATLRSWMTVTMLVLAVTATAAVVNRLREGFGVAGATSSWLIAATVFSLAWFGVSWSLPRGTTDPAALLPGAVLVGGSFTLIQWFLQFYLPGRMSRASELAGATGTSVAVLGAMFLIGRVMAASFVLNGLVHERLGGISSAVFSLPGLRRIPTRFPAVARFFDVDPAPPGGSSTTERVG